MLFFLKGSNHLKPVILALILPTFFLTFSSMNLGEKDGLKIGKKAPLADKKMASVDGNQYALADLTQTNGLIVIFSCNTCPFVVGNSDFEGWEKQYNEIHRVAADKNIGVVLINSNQGKRDGDDSFIEMQVRSEKMGYTMPYLVDENSELADAFGAKTTPHVYVFNASNKLVYKGSIDNSWDSKRTNLEPYLYMSMDFLAGGIEIKENSTPPRGCSIKRIKKEVN